MDIKITTHALIRRYERFNELDFYPKINKEKLTKDITNDFNNSTRFSFTKDISLFKSEQAIYVVIFEENIPKIITTYPLKTMKYDISILENIRIIYKCNLSYEEKAEIEPIIKSEDYLVVKHDGRKKLIWTNGYLLFCSRDIDNEIITYSIYDIWSIDDLKDSDTLSNIHSKYFDSEAKWNEFLKDVELFEYVYNPVRKESLPSEITVYKQVLSGELSQFPFYYWQEDIGSGSEIKIAAQICTKYMIEEILHWNVYEICNQLNKDIFIENKLGGMLAILFDNNIFEALDNAYPNKYPIGMIKQFNVTNYWKKENEGIKHAKKALMWAVEDCKKDGLIINKNVLLGYNWKAILKKYNISKILTTTFKNDYKEFLETIFDVEISDEDYERYLNPLDKRTIGVKAYY